MVWQPKSVCAKFGRKGLNPLELSSTAGQERDIDLGLKRCWTVMLPQLEPLRSDRSSNQDFEEQHQNSRTRTSQSTSLCFGIPPTVKPASASNDLAPQKSTSWSFRHPFHLNASPGVDRLGLGAVRWVQCGRVILSRAGVVRTQKQDSQAGCASKTHGWVF